MHHEALSACIGESIDLRRMGARGARGLFAGFKEARGVLAEECDRRRQQRSVDTLASPGLFARHQRTQNAIGRIIPVK